MHVPAPVSNTVAIPGPDVPSVVVVGASGLVGAKLVDKLTARGVSVTRASRRTGVDVITGAGLAGALAGAATVVDVTDSPSYTSDALRTFFATSTAHLTEAEKQAGVGHHVALSVVGAGRMPDSDYESAKVAQERAIADSGVPYTVLAATQFFEFARTIADTLSTGETIRVPAALIQPIAADDVAAQLAEVALSPPVNGIVEVGGPETMPLSDFLSAALSHQGDQRAVVVDPEARYFGARLEQHTLTTQHRLRGAIRLSDWLAAAQP